MIECETVIYQPGTGTRYTLTIGIVKEREDIQRLCCKEGDLFLAWDGHGCYTFGPGVHPNYLAEKLKIEQYMYDAEALTQLVRARLGMKPSEEWPVCPECNLPYHKKGMRSNCYCQETKT